MAIVKVDIRDDEQSADLVSALSARMAHSEIPSRQQVIFEPSDVVTFQLAATTTVPVSKAYISRPVYERECRNIFRQMETAKGSCREDSESDATGECS